VRSCYKSEMSKTVEQWFLFEYVNTICFAFEGTMEDLFELFELFDLFEVQPEGGRLWRGSVNGREIASSKLAELSAKSGKAVFAMNL
jgi:hypothetical protein